MNQTRAFAGGLAWMVATALAVVPALWPLSLKPHPWSVGFLVVIGGVLIVYASFGLGKKRTAPSTETAIAQTANPSITNSPTFTNAPIFAPQIILPPLTPAATQEVPAPTPSIVEQSGPNVVCLGATYVKIRYSGPGYSDSTEGMHSFSEVHGESAGDMIALVARFRNEAIYGQRVEAVSEVRAHIKLFDRSDREIGTGFSPALWLGHATDVVSLLPNGSGESVMVYWRSSDPRKSVRAIVS